MDCGHIGAQSAQSELWLHLFALARPWEFNFLVSPQAPLLYALHPTLKSFTRAFVSVSSSPPAPTHRAAASRTRTSGFTFSQTAAPLLRRSADTFAAESSSLDIRLPFFAVGLSAVVSVDVEWAPNPLKEHVGTVCISFSHLGERPQPFLFTGIPCPLSAQPQPKALA